MVFFRLHFSAVIFILLILSCSSPPDLVEKGEEKSGLVLPEWFYNPPKEEGFFFGMAGSPELDEAKRKSLINAGQQFGSHVKSILKEKMLFDGEEAMGVYESITEQITNQSIKGAKFYDQFQDNKGYYWVLTRAPFECLIDVTEGVVLSYMLEYKRESEPFLKAMEDMVIRKSEIMEEYYHDYVIYDFKSGWNLIPDENELLWTGTETGLASFDYEKDSWTHYNWKEIGLKSSTIGTIMPDKNNIWVSYGWANDPQGLGVSRWDRTTGKIEHFGSYMGTPGMPGGPVWTISKQPDTGYIWIGTRFDYAASYYDGKKWNPFYIEEGKVSPEAGDTFFDCNTIRFMGDFGLFESYRGGLHIYDFSSSRWIHSKLGTANGSLSYIERGFYQDLLTVADSDRFFLGASDNIAPEAGPIIRDGIWQYEEGRITNISPPDFKEGTNSGPLIIDNEGRLWVHYIQDGSIRIWDGKTWDSWSPHINEADNPVINLEFFEENYLWFNMKYTKNGTEVEKLVRYQL